MRIANLLLFAFSLMMILSAKGQGNRPFLRYGVEQGLSQNSVHCIFRDSKGMMWFGTQDGLNSFDGRRFTIYRHSEKDSTSISDQFIISIAEDPEGRLWVGTRNGLNCLQPGTGVFRRYYIDPSERHVFQSEYADFTFAGDTVLIFKDGVWALLPESGKILQLQKHNEKRYVSAGGFAAWAISNAGAVDFIADIRKNETRKYGSLPDSLLNILRKGFSVTAMKGKLFIRALALPQQVLVFDTEAGRINDVLKPNADIQNLIADGDSALLLCTSKGIEEWKPDEARSIWKRNVSGISEGLPRDYCLSALRDKDGNLWAGYSGKGIGLINPVFNHYRLLSHQDELFRSIVTQGNNIYAGSRNGLFSLNVAKVAASNAAFEPILNGVEVEAMSSGANSIFFAVKGDGIWQLQGGKYSKFSAMPNRELISVMHLFTTKSGKLLVSTTGGLFVLDALSGKIFGSSNRQWVEGTYVMSTYEDDAGDIWVAHNQGLDVFDSDMQHKRSFLSGTDQQSFIKRTIVSNVCQDSTGAYWIATIRNGLYKLQGDSISHYTTANGLTSDVVYNVVADEKGRIWATTSSGLCVYVPQEDRIYGLTPLDGVPRRGFVFGAAHAAHGGIYFGTTDGIQWANATAIDLKPVLLQAVLQDIKVNNESVGKTFDGLRIMAYNKLVTFYLGHQPSLFPGNVIYQYRLTDLQSEWQTLPPGLNQISFNGLPFRKLSFELRVAPSVSALEEATVYKLNFQSVPPFHRSLAFRLLMIGLLLIAVFIVVTAFNRRRFARERQKLEMERSIQAERIRLGRDLHDNIGAYTSALISGINRIRPSNQEQSAQIADLREYGMSMMGLLRETIWMLHAETLLATALADRFKQFAMRIGKNYSHIQLSFAEQIEQDRKLAPGTAMHLFRMLQEALMNALKHSNANSIRFEIVSKEKLCFVLQDNGDGISENSNGGGYGLNNIRARAKEAGFSVTLISGDDGTRIVIEENTANAA